MRKEETQTTNGLCGLGGSSGGNGAGWLPFRFRYFRLPAKGQPRRPRSRRRWFSLGAGLRMGARGHIESHGHGDSTRQTRDGMRRKQGSPGWQWVMSEAVSCVVGLARARARADTACAWTDDDDDAARVRLRNV